MAENKLLIGRIPVNKGVYASGKTYNKLSYCSYCGSTYMSLVDGNASAPCIFNEETQRYEHANTDVWQCIADGLDAYNAGNDIQTLSAQTSIFDDNGIAVSANPMSFTSNAEFAFAMVDSEDKLLFGIRNDGSVYQCAVDDLTQAQIDTLKTAAFDAINSFGKRRGEMLYEGTIKNIIKKVMGQFGIRPNNFTYDYEKTVKNYFAPEDSWETVFPTIVPQWDRTPRLGKAEGVYINATPEKFQRHIEQALNIIKDKQQEHKVIFMKSWNEWGEGNYVEPDIYFGDGFLKAIKNSLIEQ